MLYVKNLSIAVGKTQASPATDTIKIWRGVIHSIDVFIPPSHSGLAKLQIYHGGHIIMPTNQDGYISGNDTTVSGKFFIDLNKDVNVITLSGWNDDDTWPHEFIVMIGVLPKWILMPSLMIQSAIEGLQNLFK